MLQVNLKVLLTVLMLLFLFGEIQGKEESLHFIKQKPNTSESVKAFFKKLNIDSDTAYVIFLPPMSCPRCEGLINPFLIKLKQIKPNATSLLFAFYPIEKAARKYLNARKFLVNKQYILTTNEFEKNFEFSTFNLQVPIIAKFEVRKGKLLNQLSTIGVNLNDSLVTNFINENKFIDAHQSKMELSSNPLSVKLQRNGNAIGLNALVFHEKYPIKERITDTLSVLSKLDISGNYITAQDDLSLSIVMLKKVNKSWIIEDIVSANDIDSKRFISKDVPDSVVRLLTKINLINTMFFAPQIFNKQYLGFTASLPKIYWENIKTEDLAYANQLMIIFKNLVTKQTDYITIKHNDTIDIKHTSAYITRNGKNIIMPISRGWPTKGNTLIPPDSLAEKNDNPFSKEFYNFTPALALFDSKGVFVKYIGTLPNLYKESRTGYTYSTYAFFEDKQFVYTLDRYSGALSFYDINSLTYVRSLSLFGDFSKMAIEHTFQYMKNYKNVLQEHVIDFIVKDDKVNVITKKGDYYYCRSFSMNSNRFVNELFVPNMFNGNIINNCFFAFSDDYNSYHISSLVQNNDEMFFYYSKENPLEL